MQRFVNAVRAAAKCGIWYAAIPLALALPDMCGKYRSPGKGSHARYEEWWEKYGLPRYRRYNRVMDEERIYLNGSDAYALRCACLHEGAESTEGHRASDMWKRFAFIDANMHLNVNQQLLQLHAGRFCEDICDGVEQWIKDVAGDAEIQKAMSENLMTVQDGSDGVIKF